MEQASAGIRGGRVLQLAYPSASPRLRVNPIYPLAANSRARAASRSPGVVLSVSPELFFDWDGEVITTRPMKGTAARGSGPVADQAAAGPLALAGFSFGAFVTTHVLAAVQAQRDVRHVVLIGTAASRFQVATIAPELHARTLVVHGEADDTVPLSSVMDWARPQSLPVLVVPDGGHFFHGQLPLLRDLVWRHLRA